MADTTTRSSGLAVTVEQPSSFARRLSITVPKEHVERVRRSVAQQVTRNVRLPGFRKGHIPQNLLDKQFGPAIQQETVDRLIQETYPQALEQENIRPIAQGQVQDVHYHEGGDLHYDVDVEVQPAIELARISGFVVARPTDEVTEADVDGVLERLRADRAELVVVDDRTPDVGDEVQVRITPAAAETPLGEDAPEAEEFKFVLGEGQAIPAIEAAIQSLQPGEEGEFDVEFPEDYGDAEQAGTTQRLKIGVVELKARTFPELDDAFAQSLGDFTDMAGLRERVMADLQADARQRADQGYRDALLGQIVDANQVDVPPSMVENYLEYMTGGMTGGGRGGKKAPRTPEQEERFSQFREMLRPQAEATLKRMLVVETLADREGLRATQDEVDARVEQIAGQSGRSPSDVWLELEKGGQLQSLEADITEGKVLEWLRSHNTDG